MKNKKGISAVVATVLIILITVAAVTIIWAAIIPMINDNLEKGTVCLDAMSQISVENKGYTCYNASASEARVQVSHGSKDIGLVGLQFLITENGDSTSNTNDTLSALPGINENSMIMVSYINSTVAGPEYVSIAPIVSVGNSEEICDAGTPVKLEAC